jgi:hypothetical protein
MEIQTDAAGSTEDGLTDARVTTRSSAATVAVTNVERRIAIACFLSTIWVLSGGARRGDRGGEVGQRIE